MLFLSNLNKVHNKHKWQRIWWCRCWISFFLNIWNFFFLSFVTSSEMWLVSNLIYFKDTGHKTCKHQKTNIFLRWFLMIIPVGIPKNLLRIPLFCLFSKILFFQHNTKNIFHSCIQYQKWKWYDNAIFGTKNSFHIFWISNLI